MFPSCCRNKNTQVTENVYVDTMTLPQPEYAEAWSFDSYYHDNSYDINFFDSKSIYLYTFAINAKGKDSIVGHYEVDTMKYTFINVVMPNNTDTIYTLSGSFDIEYVDSTQLYRFNGECVLPSNTLLLFDIKAPIVKTTDWMMFKENVKNNK